MVRRRCLLLVVAGLAGLSLTSGGCSLSGPQEQILIVKTQLGWERSEGVGRAEYRSTPRRYTQAEYRAAQMPGSSVKTSDGRQIMMGSLIRARQAVADVAAARGLASATPTDEDWKNGWTESYVGAAGQLATREDKEGRYLEIRVREGEREESELTLAQEVGVRLSPKQ